MLAFAFRCDNVSTLFWNVIHHTSWWVCRNDRWARRKQQHHQEYIRRTSEFVDVYKSVRAIKLVGQQAEQKSTIFFFNRAINKLAAIPNKLIELFCSRKCTIWFELEDIWKNQFNEDDCTANSGWSHPFLCRTGHSHSDDGLRGDFPQFTTAIGRNEVCFWWFLWVGNLLMMFLVNIHRHMELRCEQQQESMASEIKGRLSEGDFWEAFVWLILCF